MKITHIAKKINLNQVMDISVDVHKDTLNFFFASAGREYTDICSNRTDVIQRRIIKYQNIAKEHGMSNLRIICEPTGQYQNSLLRTARRNGCLTCYVNAESVNFSIIDFVVVGEGEQTLTELIEKGNEEAHSVQGIVYRDANGEICFTGYRSKAIDLDTLPFPAYEKLAGYPDVYKLLIFNYPKSPNSSCISSRGCPYSCSYCDRSVFRRSFRYNSADYMYEHLRYLKKRFNIRHIIFYDDQFTFNRQRIEDFTRMLLDRPLGMTFNCVVRAEHIDLELLRRLKASGCWMISLGIETGDEDLLAQHRRNVNLNLLAEKIRLIKKVGIRTKGLLMIGLPGETEDSIKKTMKYVFSLPIDDINLAKFTPFPGAPVYENIHKLGEFNEDWEKMDCMHFQFIPNGMTRVQMEELFLMFYKTHFLRPKVLWNYTTMLWRSPDSWLRFILNIADFLNFAKSNKRLGCT